MACTAEMLDRALASGGRWVEFRHGEEPPNYFAGPFVSHRLAKLAAQEGVDPSNASQLPYMPETLWRWTPPASAPHTCALQPVTHCAFCRAMSSLGLSRMVSVGDSLQWHMSMSLHFLLMASNASVMRTIEKGVDRVWSVHELDCGKYGVPNVRMERIRSDLLDVHPQEIRGANGARYATLCRHRTTSTVEDKNICHPFMQPYATGNASTLLFVNIGAHVHSHALFTQSVDAFFEGLHGVAAGHQRDFSRDQIILRTTAPGHENCSDAQRPLSEPPIIPSKYDWDKIPAYNEAVRRPPVDSVTPLAHSCSWIRPWVAAPAADHRAHHSQARERLHNATSVLPMGLHVLDVAPMTTLRPDGHAGIALHLDMRPFAQPDCLHYSLPGVPDWWNAALVALLCAIGPACSHHHHQCSASVDGD